MLVSKEVTLSFPRITGSLLICCVIVQGVIADTITYQQLRQDQGSRAFTTAPIPAVARTYGETQNHKRLAGVIPSTNSAMESSSQPEFVRLPDGRILAGGPGAACDENCIDPVAPAAFREESSKKWLIIAPIVAGAVICALLCRSSDGQGSEPLPPIAIPTPNPFPPTNPNAGGPFPPSSGDLPADVPEPGTLVLLGIGLGTMLIGRRRRSAQAAKQANMDR
jgi:PEP-CTERM motif